MKCENEYQDRLMNLTHEKTRRVKIRKDTKRNFIKCEKTEYILTKFVLFSLE